MTLEEREVIRLDRVTKRFGEVTAVDDITLDFRENEFFALLGPSGCGKTTLLRMAAGFERPDEGRIYLDGEDITELRPNRRPVNLMFQSYALFPHMTVWANVAYGLEMEGAKGDDLARRVGEALDQVQLSEQARRKPEQLSGGQRQRVALARALVKRPRVLLLDEPLGALDKKLREQMQLELKRLQHEVGITFVVVTHDQEEALVMADRIALLDRGRLVQLDRPRDLYEHPKTRFAAAFIGLMNFFDGEVAADGLAVPGLATLKGEVPNGLEIGAKASLAVRPERLRLARDQDAAAANCLAGKVVDIAYHGQDVGVHVGISGLPRPLLVRLPCGDEIAAGLDLGEPIYCHWAARHSRLLAG